MNAEWNVEKEVLLQALITEKKECYYAHEKEVLRLSVRLSEIYDLDKYHLRDALITHAKDITEAISVWA